MINKASLPPNRCVKVDLEYFYHFLLFETYQPREQCIISIFTFNYFHRVHFERLRRGLPTGVVNKFGWRLFGRAPAMHSLGPQATLILHLWPCQRLSVGVRLYPSFQLYLSRYSQTHCHCRSALISFFLYFLVIVLLNGGGKAFPNSDLKSSLNSWCGSKNHKSSQSLFFPTYKFICWGTTQSCLVICVQQTCRLHRKWCRCRYKW